jgi:hypothetical protein
MKNPCKSDHKIEEIYYFAAIKTINKRRLNETIKDVNLSSDHHISNVKQSQKEDQEIAV